MSTPPRGTPTYKQNPGVQPTRHAPVPPGQQGTREVLDTNFADEDASGHLTDQPDPQPPIPGQGKDAKLPQ